MSRQDITLLITNIINYLRRSRQDIEREKRTGEDTLATQKKIMTKVLDDLRIPYEQVSEIGSGDKIETRPVFQQVLRDVENGKYNAIAVKEIPRLGRGTYSDMGKIYDLLLRKRVFIITPYKIYDPQNPADARQIRFELFFAREEFEMIKERLISAKYNLANEGKWVCGAAPYGYKLNKHTMRLDPFEEEAQIVQLIFTLYVYGIETDDPECRREVSFRAIATYLTRLGISTPRNAKSWSYLSVKRMLENDVYNGTLRYRTRKRIGNQYFDRPEDEWIVVPNAHLPIIDPETWMLAQKRLKNREKIPNTKLDFSPCELAGLIVCNHCGKRMVRQYNVQKYVKKNSEVSTYNKEFLWCTTPGCTFVKYRQVEESIIEYLKQLDQIDVEKLEEVYIDLYNSQKEVAATIESVDSSNLANKKIEELKRKLHFICEKYESGIYDDAMFLERKSEIQKEIDLLSKIPKSDSEPIKEKVTHDFIEFKNNIKSIVSAYTTCKNKTLKNELLRRIIDVVILNKTGKGTFDLVIQPKILAL